MEKSCKQASLYYIHCCNNAPSKWERLESEQFSPCLSVVSLLASFLLGEKIKNTLKIRLCEKWLQLACCVVLGSLLNGIFKNQLQSTHRVPGLTQPLNFLPRCLFCQSAVGVLAAQGSINTPTWCKATRLWIAFQQSRRCSLQQGHSQFALPCKVFQAHSSRPCTLWEPKLTP